MNFDSSADLIEIVLHMEDGDRAKAIIVCYDATSSHNSNKDWMTLKGANSEQHGTLLHPQTSLHAEQDCKKTVGDFLRQRKVILPVTTF